MSRQSYSYRKLFKYPIKVYSIGKGEKGLVFSKGIEIRQIVVSLLILSILIFFRDSFQAFLPESIELAFYTAVPWMTSGVLCRARLDGKRLDRFFIGYFRYLFNRPTRYSSGRKIHRDQKAQVYEPFKS